MKTLFEYMIENGVDFELALKISKFNNEKIDKFKSSIFETSSYVDEEDKVCIHHDESLLIYKIERLK